MAWVIFDISQNAEKGMKIIVPRQHYVVSCIQKLETCTDLYPSLGVIIIGLES